MVLNIASAGLTWTALQQNSTDSYVSYSSYCLSITQLALIVFYLYTMFADKNDKYILSFFLLVVQVYNIAYSAYVIQYYQEHILIDTKFANMTLAIFILNSLWLVGCWGSHTKRDDNKQSQSGARGGPQESHVPNGPCPPTQFSSNNILLSKNIPVPLKMHYLEQI
jgi:hypothetical protein